MSELRNRMIADMTLHGLAPGTQKVYLSAVERLSGHYQRSPDRLSEQETPLYLHITQSVKQSVQSAVNDLTTDL